MENNITHCLTIKSVTGIKFRLTPHDTILQVSTAPSTVTVLVQTHKVHDQKKAEVLATRTFRLYQISLVGGTWKPDAVVMVTDPAFTKILLAKY